MCSSYRRVLIIYLFFCSTKCKFLLWIRFHPGIRAYFWKIIKTVIYEVLVQQAECFRQQWGACLWNTILLVAHSLIYIYTWSKKVLFRFFQTNPDNFWLWIARIKIQIVAGGKEHACNYTKESITGVFVIRPKNGPDSRKKYKKSFFEKCSYLTGPLSQGLQIFRTRRSYS